MVLKQINLTLSSELQKAATDYSIRFGFRNIQDLAAEALREKVFFSDYDNEITNDEKKIIEKFIDVTLKNKKLLSTEQELDKALS